MWSSSPSIAWAHSSRSADGARPRAPLGHVTVRTGHQDGPSSSSRHASANATRTASSSELSPLHPHFPAVAWARNGPAGPGGGQRRRVLVAARVSRYRWRERPASLAGVQNVSSRPRSTSRTNIGTASRTSGAPRRPAIAVAPPRLIGRQRPQDADRLRDGERLRRIGANSTHVAVTVNNAEYQIRHPTASTSHDSQPPLVTARSAHAESDTNRAGRVPQPLNLEHRAARPATLRPRSNVMDMASCTKEGCCLSPTSAQPGRRADCGSKRRTHRDLANGTAALFVSALGFGTTALMLRSAWLLHWLDHGHQLTAIAAFSSGRCQLNAAVYLFML